MTVEAIIQERATTHGEYATMAALAQDIKYIMRRGRFTYLKPAHQESLDLIATKIARILCGDPDYRDSWNDIQGYAALAERAISKREEG
jgi:hypothetical protein